MRCEERMRQQDIENAQLRSELRTLARHEDVARIEAAVLERVQSMVRRARAAIVSQFFTVFRSGRPGSRPRR